MRLPAGLRALRHADFRRFYAAQLVSQVGTWMQSIGQAWLVLSLTDSPFRLGLIGTLQFGPMLAFSLVTGALADRMPKRRLLMATQTALAVQALALSSLVWSGHIQYWHIGVLALLAGLTNTLDNPVRQSFVAEVVGKEDVINAVALNSAAFNGARIVGPAVGGLLIARMGVAPAFLLNALSFLVVVVVVAQMRTEGRPAVRPRATMRADIGEGLAYALREPRIRLVLGVLLVVSLSVFNFNVYVPLLARNVLGQGADGLGVLMAAVGVGAVGGALTLGTAISGMPPMRVLFATGVIACAALAGLGTVRAFPLALAVLFVVGYAGIMTVAGCNTSLQMGAPDDLRGRVISLYALLFGGTVPIGAFVVGAVSERWGVGAAMIGMGLTGVAGLGAILAVRRARLRRMG
jgi:predicted MFS family arabinose efflux permease